MGAHERFFLLAFPLLLAPSTAHALRGGWPTAGHPEVGRFENGRGLMCSGTLVGPRHVLTAASCVDPSDPIEPDLSSHARFLVGSTAFAVDDVVSFRTNRPPPSRPSAYHPDLALLRLDRGVSASLATPARLGWLRGPRTAVLGHGCVVPGSSTWVGSRQIRSLGTTDLLAHYCDEGDRGGAVLDGDGRLIGVLIDRVYDPQWGWGGTYVGVQDYRELIEDTIRQMEGGLEPGFARSNGQTLRALTRSSPEACRETCRLDPQCRAFDFATSSGSCRLIATGSDPAPLPGWTSGQIGYARPGTGFASHGAVYRASRPSPGSWASCERTCRDDARCRMWSFEAGTCNLSGRMETLVSRARAYSGVRDAFLEPNTHRRGAEGSIRYVAPLATYEWCSAGSLWSVVPGVECVIHTLQLLSPALVTLGATSRVPNDLLPRADLYGHDYQVVTEFSAETCQSECRGRCRAFTFDRRNRACYLKDGAPVVYSTAGMRSGYRFDAAFPFPVTFWFEDPPHTDRYGADYRSFRVDDAEVCRSTCQGDARCRAWTWTPPREDGVAPACFLKSGLGSVRSTAHLTSGYAK